MAGLPVSEEKSLPLQKVERELIPFLGCNIDLVKRMVLPMPDKISKIAAFVHTLQVHEPIPLRKWESVTGKLLFYAILNRPILSALEKLYEGVPRSIQDTLSISPPKDRQFTPSSQQIAELERIVSISPLSAVSLDLPFFPFVLAFDASHVVGAVVKTSANSDSLQSLFVIAARLFARKDATQTNNKKLEDFMAYKY